MNIKTFIPSPIRLQLRRFQRLLRDIQTGYFFQFACIEKETSTFLYSITIKQDIKQSYLFENKKNNLQLASQQVNQYIIHPNQILSFWNCIGTPTASNGFQKGRNIINGILKEDYGGGLCQLSGILYHLSLIAGLTIIERHNHTKDIYTEESRYTPLGSDATVVYGYKDLRIQNPYPFSIQFKITIENNQLIAHLYSQRYIIKEVISFNQIPYKNGLLIHTHNSKGLLLETSLYLKNK